MPTPIGHSLAGLAVFALTADKKREQPLFRKETLWWAAYCIVLSNIPDLDFFHFEEGRLILTGKYHHGISHSLGFSLAIGFAAWIAAKLWRFNKPGKIFAVSFSLCWLHSIIDMFNFDGYALNGIGLPLLWPLTDKYFIIPFIPPPDRNDPFSTESLLALLLEIALYGTLFLGAWLWRRFHVENTA